MPDSSGTGTHLRCRHLQKPRLRPRSAVCWTAAALMFASCRGVQSGAARSTGGRHTHLRVTAAFAGKPEPVFDTHNACEQVDIVDAVPRAFRDFQNNVHLIASHYVVRAMVGPDLDRVKHSCRVIYRSPQDADPANFLDANWLDSLYTEDGRRVAALVHTEYHGDEHPGMCGDLSDPNHGQNCAWTSITYAESHDGGYTFEEPHPPLNLVASLPYLYDKFNKSGAQGYNSPTNIIKIDQYFYSILNVWREYKAQRYGPCLIRTSNPFEPASWRAWNGKAFAVTFIDPYVDATVEAGRHVCFPIVEGTIDSLAVDQRTGLILGDVYVEDNRYGSGPGLYLLATRDLLHWTFPVRVASTSELVQEEPAGHWSYLYFAILDPQATDRNFSTISPMPYLYYVRLDDDNPPYSRVLFRRRLKISISQN